MDYFSAVEARRSVRRYTNKEIPAAVVEKALAAACLAPNSSNTQTWDFYWVKTPEKKAKLVTACLSQSAARTAAELVVITADPRNWRRSQPELLRFVESINAPAPVITYYKKLIPFMYSWGPLNVLAPFKWILSNSVGLFRPMPRGPNGKSGLQEVAIKSAALAAENFVLAIAAQGYATCMMEGFDESRVKKLLQLPSSARVVMVISVGEAAPDGVWGARFRIDQTKVIHQI